MSLLTRAERRALIRSLGGYGTAWAPSPGERGTRASTWRSLQVRGFLDPESRVPCQEVPEITEAGLRALGLPDSVRGPDEALAVAVRTLVLWRRPRVRLGEKMDFVHTDDPESDTEPPISWCAHPCVIATVDCAAEDVWEACGGDPAESWQAIEEWTARVGFPLDISRRGGVRVVLHDPDDLCAEIAWVDCAWRRIVHLSSGQQGEK